MAGTDPSANLVPGKNFVPPPGTPDSLSVSVTPGSNATVPITTGYDAPSRVQLAAAQLKQPTASDGTVGGDAKPPAAPAASAPPVTDVPSAVTGILGQSDPRFDAFWNSMLPGESGGKNVPNYRYDRTHTASGTAQITDTNWKEIAPKLGIDINHYPTAMSAPPDYQKAVAKLMWRMNGQAPWDAAHGGALPVGNPNQSAADAYWQGQVATIQQGYADRYEKTSKNLQDAVNQLRAGDGDIGKAMERIRAAQDKADRAQDEAYRAIAQQPKEPVIDGVKHLNSIAVIVGLLGGLMTKAPMLASTNAAAAAIEAYNAGDLRAFHMAHDNWKNQTDLLFKIADENAARVHDIITEEKIPIEEKRARLDAMLRINGQQDLAEQIRLQGMEVGLKYWQENERLKADRARIFEDRDKGIPLQQSDGSYVLWHPLSGTKTPMPGTPQSAAIAAQRRDQISPEARVRADARYEAWVALPENAGKSDQEKQEQLWKFQDEAQGQISAAKKGAGADSVAPDETLDQMADQYIAGDSSVFVGLGQGTVGATNRIRLRTKISQKMMTRETEEFRTAYGRDPTPQEKQALSADIGRRLALSIAEYGGLKQAERTAMGRAAQISMGAAESEQFAPIALEQSEKVDRTKYKDLNSVILATQERTGDLDVVRFTEANVALIDAYAQVIGRGNAQLTDAARDQATRLLNMNWSKDQYRAAVEQIRTEIRGAQAAPDEVLTRFRLSFGVNGRLPDLSTHSPSQFSGGGAARPPGAAQPSGGTPPGTSMPVPEAYRNDPDGTPLKRTGPNGQTEYWVKKGDQIILTPGAVETPR